MNNINDISAELWIAIGMALMTILSVGVSIATALTSIRKSSFDQLEERVLKLERRLKTALVANTKMRAIIQDMIDIMEDVIDNPVVPMELKEKAHSVMERARKELVEAELLLVESVTSS